MFKRIITSLISLLILAFYTASGLIRLISPQLHCRNPSLPAVFRNHQSAIKGNLINLAKAAGMASVIASPNAVLVINSLATVYNTPLVLMCLLAAFYYLEIMVFSIIICILSEHIFIAIETRIRTGEIS